MAYDARLVVQVAAAALVAAPARRLGAVAAACGVSRHTLVRACLKCGAGSARDLRDAVLHRRMHALMTAAPPKTIKEISDALGFSTPQSFARWLKRADGVVPQSLRGELCRRLTAPDDSGWGVEAGTLRPQVRGDAPHG
jgi:AraC-like DNA-binding protein